MGTLRAIEDMPGEHPCCERCSALCRLARGYADLMRLRDWIVEVGHDPPTDHAGASIEMADGRMLARLRFAEDFVDLAPEEQRHRIVHELVHPLLRDLWASVEDGVEGELSGSARRVYLAAVSRDLERAVDALAAVIAPGMPLPEW